MKIAASVLLAVCAVALARADDGYRLWLRYDRMTQTPLHAAYAEAASTIVLASPVAEDSATGAAVSAELNQGLGGLLGVTPKIRRETVQSHPDLGDEGYAIDWERRDGHPAFVITANRNVGVLYGAFALLRELRLGRPLDHFALRSTPRIQRRMLDHWDNLNRTVERGYAGGSLWEWFVLPNFESPRYRDYARACASVGLNGAVVTNVNADALVLTPEWLSKVAALASAFRPYGVRVYLTARFSAPLEIGGLKTADPLDPAVAAWWRAKAREIHELIPDFGGFLVKANSEGQPGPQSYGRSHADGANMLADALAPVGGIVLWRAFVYEADARRDRCMQAYDEFEPYDGKFRPNVVVQIKNGPLDFQPREPFHPLFGAMPRTPLALEVQITQEYLGQGTHLAFLAPLWKETLDSDTFRPGRGSTVARVVDGSLSHNPISVIAGVANTGTDRNWTGHPLAQANWYAFGRLAWDHTLSSAQIASEWTHLTFGDDPRVTAPLERMLLESRETVVDYMDPLGLTGVFAEGHHYGPEPWLDKGRPDWTSVYYHHADSKGLGFDRTQSGSNALEQYAPVIAGIWRDEATCPEDLILWFHHVAWDRTMASGRPFWDEFCRHYQHGVDTVRGWRRTWDSLKAYVDPETHAHVSSLLAIQERDACWWRDASLLYFQTFSGRPLPPGVEPPAHDLPYYRAIQLHWMPGDPSGK